MLSKTIFSVLAFALMLVAAPALAFNQDDLTQNNGYQELRAYNKDFDILVFDFTLANKSNSEELLNALTVYNNRTASDGEDIVALKLWADDGDNLWQGLGRDNVLGTAEKTDNKHWFFNNLNVVVPTGGLHLYISMETKNTVTNNRKLQLEIERLSDINGNQAYDYGDTGIFLSSHDNGPVDQNFVSNYVYTFEQKNGDVLAPKVAITNLKNGEVITNQNSFTVNGVAQDRMQGSVKFLQVSFVPTGTQAVWQNATAIAANFASFQYLKENITAGSYDVSTYTSDWDGNFSISAPLAVSFQDKAVVPVVTEPTVTSPEESSNSAVATLEPIKWTGRLIKTKASPAVYLLVNNKKYWFLNEKVFFQYYKDFSDVEIISDVEMNSYSTGGGAPMKKGMLIKTATSDKVYETGDNSRIRWILNEAEAKSLYGDNWASKIQVISEEYLQQYNLVTTL